ncbi:MAG: glycoside hydrolase family 78 protein [Prevotellaceae bacterium]|nr:glycoside hydrolase family 78 protein [Prevotellaceae bacterium]
MTNPSGIDVAAPRFSWTIAADERGVYQEAYRIIVSHNRADVQQLKGNSWDSGWRNSDNTINVAYEGSALESNHPYFWRVGARINGQELWSEPAAFHTGMLHYNDWSAAWISTEEELVHASPLLRKSFVADKRIKEAHAYVAAAGFYELYVNGQKVGSHVMHPAITDYRKTLLYSVYDLSDMLNKGNNALGLMLGNGAYNIRKSKERYSWGSESRLGNPCVMLQLQVTFDDGSEAVITTGEGWKYTFGSITYNNIYGGEDYDARKDVAGWSDAGFDDAKWKRVAVVPSPGGQLKWQATPIEVTETLPPVASSTPARGVYLFDLGQNIAGWWRIELQGRAGQTIRVRGAETLNNALFPKPLEDGDRLSNKFSYHASVWTDYTLRSDNKELYEPRFFYTGFRYIEIAVSDSIALNQLRVEGRVVRSALPSAGQWTSSNTLLNKIHQAGLWSQKANTVGYPTDCPHREKGAYNGDGQVIAETSMHDFLMAPFYYKWLDDMRDSQEPNGRVPNTSPPVVGGMGGGVAWGSAYVLLPWWMYHYYDDVRVLKEHYPTMKKYINYLKTLARTDSHPAEPYIINDFDGYWYSLGEWCSPNLRDCPNHAVVNTFYYYYDTRLMAQIAAVLGYPNDAQQFLSLSDTIKAAFNAKFFNQESLLYGVDTTYQTYQLLALLGKLVPNDELREGVLKTLTDDLRNRDYHLNTGIIGTKYLLPALAEAGHHQEAYLTAIQETYPSYGFWLNNHSTTLLEKWDGQNSHNHQMFGAVVEYFYKYLAGIRSPMEEETTIGYKHVRLQPCLPNGLQNVEASMQTMSGKIVSGWERHDRQTLYHVSVPANTTATLVLPDALLSRVVESGATVWENGKFAGSARGISGIKADNSCLHVSLKSGSYRFVVSE